VAYIQSIADDEIVRLGGKPERLVIAGISQGAAIGMWTLLCQGELNRRLLAFVGASTWLPFAECIERFLGRNYEAGVKEYNSTASDSDAFVEGMMSAWRQPSQSGESIKPLLSTPVFLGHGVDDAVVDVELGRKAWLVLTQIGFQVRWREYSGAESEGHWLKVPEEVDDIAAFLLNVTST
jgi:predicted esterase